MWPRLEPLLANVDNVQWTPDMIWFDNLKAYGTPNYYVQKMYSTNPGTTMLPVQRAGNAKNGDDNLFSSATADDSFEKVALDENTSNPMEIDVAPDGRIRVAAVVSTAVPGAR